MAESKSGEVSHTSALCSPMFASLRPLLHQVCWPLISSANAAVILVVTNRNNACQPNADVQWLGGWVFTDGPFILYPKETGFEMLLEGACGVFKKNKHTHTQMYLVGYCFKINYKRRNVIFFLWISCQG